MKTRTQKTVVITGITGHTGSVEIEVSSILRYR
jgi:hypothetical protein